MVSEAMARAQRGCVSELVGKADDAVQTISAAMAAYRSTGTTVWSTSFLSFLSLAYADLGKFNDAKRCIGQAMTVIETAKEKWFWRDQGQVQQARTARSGLRLVQ